MRPLVLVPLAGLLVVAGTLPGLRVWAQSAPFFSTGQSADLMLSGYGFNRTGGPLRFNHPGGLAVVGGRLALADRNNNRVLVWSSVPRSGSELPSLVLGQDSFDTNIHDAAVLPDGRLLAGFNRSLCLWSSFPRGANEACAVQIGAQGGAGGSFDVDAGDNSGIAIDAGRVLVSLNNGNRVVVWNSLPVASSQLPEFAIGSPDIRTNTLATDAIVTNAVPLTDGRRLWLSSDFDRKLHVWRELPRESGQKPDYTYSLDFGPWASTRCGEGVVLAGTNGTVAIWNTAPEGQPADTVLRSTIGGKTLGDLRGVAWDGANFYLASYDQGRVWAWRGVPTASSVPFAEIQVTQPGRISADGRYLAVSSGAPGGAVYLYDVASLASNPSPARVGQGLGMNLPQGVTLASGGLLIADTNGNRVLAWRDTVDAAAGRNPDALLGSTDLRPRNPAIGQDTLFWPGAVAYDGSRLWVGEFKFSNRVLRFSRP